MAPARERLRADLGAITLIRSDDAVLAGNLPRPALVVARQAIPVARSRLRLEARLGDLGLEHPPVLGLDANHRGEREDGGA